VPLDVAIPVLFGTAKSQASVRGILVSVFVLLLSAIGYLWANMSPWFPFHWLMVAGLLVHAMVALTSTGGNFLYIFRYFLVWLLIFGTAVVWALFDGVVLVAPFGVEYQTPEATRLVVLAGVWSLCGSLIGWHLAMLNSPRGTATSALGDVLYWYRRRLLRGGAILAVGFSVLYVIKAGGLLGEGSAYGSNVADLGFEFGVFNIFHFTGIALLLLAGLAGDRVSPTLVWLAIASLIPGILTGSRADFLPQPFVLLLVLANGRVRQLISHPRLAKWIAYVVGAGALLFLGYVLAFVVAFWRQGIGLTAAIQAMQSDGKGLLINEIFGHPMLYLETGNMMLGGLYSVIVNTMAGWDNYLYGRSYLDYFLIAPPAFLGLPRPLGLEWSMNIGDEVMAIGGVFEVAEAYFNFGLAGCLLVSLFISYVFGRVLKYGLARGNLLVLTWYLVAGFMSFRAIWYQNFGYFRIATVMLVLYGLSLFFFRWFSRNHARPIDHTYSMFGTAPQ